MFRLGSILLSEVFGLNGTIAELSPSESAFQAHMAVEAILNFIRGKEILLLAGICPASKMNVMDQSITSC